MKKIAVCILMAAVLAAGILGGLGQVKPQQQPASAAEEMAGITADIQAITTQPHIAGSPENRAVRDMIVERANLLGLKAEVLPFELNIPGFIADWQQEYDEASHYERNQIENYIVSSGYSTLEELVRGNLNAADIDVLLLDNVLIKINGTAPQGTVMFVSHYDSVITAPGAGDDALAAACMLNLMESMAKNPPQNDVYFLFTDGEEVGLLGAADFVRTQPQYAQDVDLLFNFEARGNAGALVMFETSAQEYAIVQQFAGSVPQPVTFSIATAIYDMMPNGTDFSEFKAAGYKGLNFAMIEGSEHYHQPSDNLENLDKNTMWQYYQTMTALGTHFGNTNLKEIQHTQDAVYFPLPVAGIVMVPGLLGRILGFIPLLLALLLTIQTLRNKQLHPARRVVRIIGLLVLGLLPAAITVFLFAASYMVFIPALLFLLTDLCFGEGKGWRKWAGIAMFLLALLITALLFAPMAFFLQAALMLWYLSLIFALLPAIPAVLYAIKIVRRV